MKFNLIATSVSLVSLLASLAPPAWSESAEALYKAASAKYDGNNFKGALADCTRAIKLNPKYADAWSMRGMVKGMLNDHKGAIADFDQSIRLKPMQPQAVTARAQEKIEIGDFKGAIADLQWSLKAAPNDHLGWYFLARAYAGLHDWKNGLTSINRSLRIDPKDKNTLCLRGKLLWVLKEYKSALCDLSEVLRVDPNNSQALYFSCLTRFALHDYAGAVTDADTLSKIPPSKQNISEEDRLRARLTKAACNWALDKIQQASDQCDEVLSNKALSPQIRLPFAVIKLDCMTATTTDNVETLLASVDGFVKEYPDSAVPLYHRASLRRRKGDLDDALSDATKALSLQRSDETFGELAMCKQVKGDLKGCDEVLAEGYKNSPEGPLFRLCGEIKLLRGDKTGAAEEFAKALAYFKEKNLLPEIRITEQLMKSVPVQSEPK